MTDSAEEKIAELERDLLGVQEMLAFVLITTGPVEVTKAALREGLPQDAQINIDDNNQKDVFTFWVGSTE